MGLTSAPALPHDPSSRNSRSTRRKALGQWVRVRKTLWRWVRKKDLYVLVLIPLAINALTGYFFYFLGVRDGAKAEMTKQAVLANSYLSYGFVDLKGGPGTISSTDAMATVYLYSSPDFEGVNLRLSGGQIEGDQGNDLSGFFDRTAAGPQSVKMHLRNLSSQLVTCLTIPTRRSASNTIEEVRVKQIFKPRLVDSAGDQVVEFNSIGMGPMIEKGNDKTCLALENPLVVKPK